MIVTLAKTNREKQQAFEVRTEVFVNEQNVSPDIEMDEYDKEAIHLVGYKDDRPIAASRVRFASGFGKLERICVLKNQRGNAYGFEIIRAMEDVIADEGYTEAKLNSQTHAIDFYQRLGYNIVSDEFMDAGMPHVTMTKQLT